MHRSFQVLLVSDRGPRACSMQLETERAEMKGKFAKPVLMASQSSRVRAWWTEQRLLRSSNMSTCRWYEWGLPEALYAGHGCTTSMWGRGEERLCRNIAFR